MNQFLKIWFSKTLFSKIIFFQNFQKEVSKFFQKRINFKKKFSKKFLGKKFQKKFEKMLHLEINILFSKNLDNCFCENQILKYWSMAVWIWLFFDKLQRLIFRHVYPKETLDAF